MNKVLIVFMSVFILLGFSATAFSYPSSITLDSTTNSSGDYSDGVSLFFEHGTYELSVFSGAWNPWFSSTGVTGCDSFGANCDTGWIWSMDIYQPDTSIYHRLGSKTDRYETASLAYNAHKNDSILLNQATDGDFWFFVKDGNPGDGTYLVPDNFGSVTASVNLVHAPEPISSILFLIGGATLGFRRFFNKKKNS